jgi:hypothetical protein
MVKRETIIKRARIKELKRQLKMAKSGRFGASSKEEAKFLAADIRRLKRR